MTIILSIIIFSFSLLSASIKVIFIVVTILIVIVIGLCFNCNKLVLLILILEPNSITLQKKTSIGKLRTITYYKGELEKAVIDLKEITGEYTLYLHTLYLIKKSGKKEYICKISSYAKDRGLDGVKHFIDLINNHIQNNMK